MLKLGIQFVNFPPCPLFYPSPRPRRRRKGARATTTQMAADTAANRADLIDRLLVGFVNVPAGVVLPMIGAIVSIMFYFFNNHMFQ
jgi:hypothetical protein